MAKDETSSESGDTAVEIRNQMPHAVRLQFEATPATPTFEFELPPLGKRSIPLATKSSADQVPEDLKQRLNGLALLNVIRVTPIGGKSDIAETLIGLSIASLVPLFFIMKGLESQLREYRPIWIWAGVAVALLVIAIGIYLHMTRKLKPLLQKFWSLTIRFLTLLLMLCIAVLLPMATLVLFAASTIGNSDTWQSGLHLLLSGGSAGVGQSIHFGFVCVASAIPGLLFFLFNRKKAAQLRESFEHQIFRLDAKVKNLSDVEARYGTRLNALWGDPSQGGTRGLVSSSLWPVILCTLIVGGGWCVILLFGAIQNDFSDATDLNTLFEPPDSTYAFGFLGAYYFAINMLIRRYIRGDLQPKTYSIVTTRILAVIVVAIVLSSTPNWGMVTMPLMFAIGFVPETFILFLRENLVSFKFLKRHLMSLDRLPLTKLEGIDLYDRARLEEEGVDNLESLANADLVDLMTNTSIPISQLVEWVDQTMLYLRVHANPAESALSTAPAPAPDANPTGSEDADPLWHELRAMGVRRASDLLADDQPMLRPQILQLAKALGKSDAFVERLHSMVNQLTTDESFQHIRFWRTDVKPAPQTWEFKADGSLSHLESAT
jgi:hypothetical protein